MLPLLLERTFPRFRLRGFSRSTIATFFHLRELGVLFDVGACPNEAAAASDLLLSHLHLDHAQALPYYASLRTLHGMKPGRVHVPLGTGDGVRRWIDAFAALQGADGGRFQYTLCEHAPGEDIPLSGRLFARTLRADHRVPSLGFTVFEARDKLLPAFVGLPGAELAARRARGEPLTQRTLTPLVTYLGDTGPRVFEDHPEVGESEVLIAECTFLAPEHRENARETGHLHIEDFAERASLFRNANVLLTHFSLRYADALLPDLVRAALPEALCARVQLLL